MDIDNLIELYNKVDHLYDDLHTEIHDENNNKKVTIIELLSEDIASNVIMMMREVKDKNKIVTIEQLDAFKKSLTKLDAAVRMLNIDTKYKTKISNVIHELIEIIDLGIKALRISKFTFNLIDAEGKMSNRSKIIATAIIFAVLVATQYIN